MALLDNLKGIFKKKNSELGIRLGTVDKVNKKRGYNIQGKKIAVFQVNGEFYAINAVCTHKGGPLDEGELNGKIVTCPWHGAEFDVTSGKVVGAPAKENVASYKVIVKDDIVYVRVEEEKKKELEIKLTEKLDPDSPFGYKPFLDWLIERLKFPTKLYGILNMKMIYQDPTETDFDMGEIHITEQDLKELSRIMQGAKKKWKANITYCLYHTTQFPGHMLINIRGPNAPKSLEMDIKFGV